jgi:2-succinyl-5-enolpyruvyl-6-hydroxy-3-cyclohexene-1-carboxylate synthase
MYSNIKSVQILISLLKKYGITDVVLSPGGSDVSLVHSLEMDSDFTCYSVVDERSAAYFATGVAQMKNRPCACVCTSGTAVCNYLPGITEAFYQDVPVVAITADKNPYFQGQMETQKIEQTHIFDGVVKKAVDLPVVYNEQDEWMCNRLVNEALLELNHHGTGPVHINIPIVFSGTVYECEKLPDERKIDRLILNTDEFKSSLSAIDTSKKIMVLVGQNVVFSEKDVENMEAFYNKTNCVFAVEHLSNLRVKGGAYSYPISEMMGVAAMERLKPDVVISIGNNTGAYGWKKYIRENYKSTSNVLVSESGNVRDTYKCLDTIYECSASEFFHSFAQLWKERPLNKEHSYYNQWQAEIAKVKVPEFEFSNFYVAQKLAQTIPDDSVLHLAIQYSTRIIHYFDLAENVTTFSNYGALGIDGCYSTFAGQAAVTDKLCYLVVGDLSFFYDMNAAGLRSIGKNVRVILLNNGGGGEFQYIFGRERIPELDENICAQHNKTAGGWIKSLDYDYYSATNKAEVDRALEKFAQPSNTPMFLEVFTNMEEDAHKTKQFYGDNRSQYKEYSQGVKGTVKSLLKKVKN